MHATLTIGDVLFNTDSTALLPLFATVYEGLSELVTEHGRVPVTIDVTNTQGTPTHHRMVLTPERIELRVHGAVEPDLLAELPAKVESMHDFFGEHGYVGIPDLQVHVDRVQGQL